MLRLLPGDRPCGLLRPVPGPPVRGGRGIDGRLAGGPRQRVRARDRRRREGEDPGNDRTREEGRESGRRGPGPSGRVLRLPDDLDGSSPGFEDLEGGDFRAGARRHPRRRHRGGRAHGELLRLRVDRRPFLEEPGDDRVRRGRRFEVGNLYINRGITGAMVGRQPFGGFRMSGVGSKAGGPDYLIQFMEPRVITENTMRRGFSPDTLS